MNRREAKVGEKTEDKIYPSNPDPPRRAFTIPFRLPCGWNELVLHPLYSHSIALSLSLWARWNGDDSFRETTVKGTPVGALKPVTIRETTRHVPAEFMFHTNSSTQIPFEIIIDS